MILADTSVWVQHFRHGMPGFAEVLREGEILMHPVVIGELATGNLARRKHTLAALRRLPRSPAGTFEECLEFIDSHAIHGRGIGWSDVQLLVAARLSRAAIWALDLRLAGIAHQLGVAYSPR